MGKNVAQKLIESHLVSGDLTAGEEISLKIDQTLTQDATGTLVMLEFEAMNIPRVRTELSAQYVDHNLLQMDYKNPDDHLFLRSACKKFGVWYSRPGNGVSHPVHMEHFGIPGTTLLGSDSHTCSAGSLGMLALGAGGLEVAMAMAGEPYFVRMPGIMGVKLTGSLPDWVSGLEMDYPRFKEPEEIIINNEMLMAPSKDGASVEIEKGPNIKPLPVLLPMPERLEGPVLLKVGDDISTDGIMPAGTKVLPFRSNIPEISTFTFSQIDHTYYERAMKYQKSGSFIVAGDNYGQGSSREHAALGPRYLGLKAVVAKSFARIHWQNLCNFGILPLTFVNQKDWEKIHQNDVLAIEDARNAIQTGNRIRILNTTRDEQYETEHTMSKRQIDMVRAGSLINLVK